MLAELMAETASRSSAAMVKATRLRPAARVLGGSALAQMLLRCVQAVEAAA
jgi:hypothetical protein